MGNREAWARQIEIAANGILFERPLSTFDELAGKDLLFGGGIELQLQLRLAAERSVDP